MDDEGKRCHSGCSIIEAKNKNETPKEKAQDREELQCSRMEPVYARICIFNPSAPSQRVKHVSILVDVGARGSGYSQMPRERKD